MDILWKGIIGGGMTALIAWLAKKGNILPGVLPLFPTFGVIALYIVGAEGDTNSFQQTCIAAVKTIPAYLAFLIVCYYLVQRVNYRMTLVLGLAAWLAVALATFWVQKYLV